MKFTIFIDYRPMRNHGEIEEVSDNHYRIRINSRDSLSNQVGTLFHELGHFVFYTFFKTAEEKWEHDFCKSLDRYARNKIKRYLK